MDTLSDKLLDKIAGNLAIEQRIKMYNGNLYSATNPLFNPKFMMINSDCLQAFLNQYKKIDDIELTRTNLIFIVHLHPEQRNYETAMRLKLPKCVMRVLLKQGKFYPKYIKMTNLFRCIVIRYSNKKLDDFSDKLRVECFKNLYFPYGLKVHINEIYEDIDLNVELDVLQVHDDFKMLYKLDHILYLDAKNVSLESNKYKERIQNWFPLDFLARTISAKMVYNGMETLLRESFFGFIKYVVTVCPNLKRLKINIEFCGLERMYYFFQWFRFSWRMFDGMQHGIPLITAALRRVFNEVHSGAIIEICYDSFYPQTIFQQDQLLNNHAFFGMGQPIDGVEHKRLFIIKDETDTTEIAHLKFFENELECQS